VSVNGAHDEALERTVQVFLDALAGCATPETAAAMLAGIRSALLRAIGEIERLGSDPEAAQALRRLLDRLDRETDGGGRLA